MFTGFVDGVTATGEEETARQHTSNTEAQPALCVGSKYQARVKAVCLSSRNVMQMVGCWWALGSQMADAGTGGGPIR